MCLQNKLDSCTLAWLMFPTQPNFVYPVVQRNQKITSAWNLSITFSRCSFFLVFPYWVHASGDAPWQESNLESLEVGPSVTAWEFTVEIFPLLNALGRRMSSGNWLTFFSPFSLFPTKEPQYIFDFFPCIFMGQKLKAMLWIYTRLGNHSVFTFHIVQIRIQSFQ